MSCILNIETSTSVCSVAASQDGQTIFVKEDLKGPSHAVSLGVFVDEALSFIDSHAIPLDAVAVSCGPGSYTGLRIGVSMAKGICYGRNIPLIGIPTLEVLSVPVVSPKSILIQFLVKGFYLPILLLYFLQPHFLCYICIRKNNRNDDKLCSYRL